MFFVDFVLYTVIQDIFKHGCIVEYSFVSHSYTYSVHLNVEYGSPKENQFACCTKFTYMSLTLTGHCMIRAKMADCTCLALLVIISLKP